MKVCGGVMFGLPRAAAFPTLIFRHCRPTLRCCYSSFPDHVSFIKDVAATQPPENLNHLLKLLQVAYSLALDEAVFLLDIASVEGTWDESLGRIAECYREAELEDIAKFILHRD